jgi:hypothetical protein
MFHGKADHSLQALCDQIQRPKVTIATNLWNIPCGVSLVLCIFDHILGIDFGTRTICYAVITPSMNKAQIVFNVLSGIGQAGPLTLLVALVQFTAPHAFLSTATGLGFSARAIGGAFGSAVSFLWTSRIKRAWLMLER